MYFKQHHLISDAWSIILSGNKTLDYYLKLKNGENIDEIEEPSFINYLGVEEDYFSSKRYANNQSFWELKTDSIPEFVYLKQKPIHFSTATKRVSYVVTESISSKLNQFCKENNVSILSLFTAAFCIYASKITAKKNIAIGTTVLNRTNYKEKNTLGMFVNMIPIFFEVDQEQSFHSYLSYISSNWKSYLYNSHYPHELIVENYRQKHRVNDELFDISITYQNAVHHNPEGFSEVKSYWFPYGHQISSLNMHISNRVNSESFIIDFDYLAELFTTDEMEKLYHHLSNILENALESPEKPIALLEYMSWDEKHQLTQEFNQTQTDYRVQSLHQLFEEQALEKPDNIGLIFEDQMLTYDELNQKANQVAWMLKSKGVTPNTIVGLLAKRSMEMFIGILGILKAGGAYLPIDPACPRNRIQFILEDSDCAVLLTNQVFITNTWGGEIVNFNSVVEFEKGHNPECDNNPSDLAYVIYTSGSTGNPKGVMIEHQSIVNTVNWRKNHYQFNERDVLLQIPPYNFDSSVEDIFSFLSVGAAIVIIDQERRLDLIYLRKLIATHHVTHFLATPLLYNAMLDEIAPDLMGMSSITVAGESIPLNLVKNHFRQLPHVKLYNEYGPTENSVCSTVYQFSPDEPEVLIGKPIDNCQCYVLNKNLELLPAGIPGELYLGGAGLARGYINNPQLTEEKFVYIPHFEQRLYKTGDLVKWNVEGNLQFIERIDNQVKIRGFRIELGEIEYQLLKHPSIGEAVAVVGEDLSGNKFICSYYVSRNRISGENIKEFLAKSLPEYMIPTYFMALERLPLTPNGKIDKLALPKPDLNSQVIYEPPCNDVEKILVDLWQEILGNGKIGINDNLFEIGGDSLAVIQALTMCYNYHWELKAQDFYKYPTIKELACYILSCLKSEKDIVFERPSLVLNKNLQFLQRESGTDEKLPINRKFKKVLVTGVTGYLGVHLLHELLKNKDIQIFTLVRGSNVETAKTRLYKQLSFYYPHLDKKRLNRRIVIVNGDIAEPKLGLSQDEYFELSQQIDTVIHAAAIVKHYGDDRQFLEINVNGTRNICEFSQDKYLAYISTTSVSGDYDSRNDGIDFDENCIDVGQYLDDNSYVKSKLEAEKIVFEQIQNGLDGVIIRVGNLTGRHLDGLFQLNIGENKFYQVLKSIFELSVIPDSLLDLELEFTPVDLCSQGIIKILRMKNNSGRIFHLFNHQYLKMKNLIEMLNGLGNQISIIPDERFYTLLKQLSTHKFWIETLSGIIPDIKNGKLSYGSYVNVDSSFSVGVLQELNFSWPSVDITYIRKIFGYMHSIEFIKKARANYQTMG